MYLIDVNYWFTASAMSATLGACATLKGMDLQSVDNAWNITKDRQENVDE